MYTVKRLKIGKTEQLDTLARECGRLYSQTVTWFWRTVNRKGIWLKPASAERWFNSDSLHAHTADATVQAFFASLKSWRVRRKTDPDARAPRKRKHFFRVEYKNSAIRLRGGQLILSNGRNAEPLVLPWAFDCPQTLVIHWTGTEYEAIATYVITATGEPAGERTAGVDLGEIHIAVAHDGENTTILNGRVLRSKRQYRNKLVAKLSSRIDSKPRGSKRRRRLVTSKRRQLRTIDNQIRDITHKLTTALITTLHRAGVRTLVVGDLRDLRKRGDYGPKANQRIHQMPSGETRFQLQYKAERLGMETVLQEESYTSQTCCECGERTKPRGREYVCSSCGFRFHRDGVGAVNIRSKYLACGPVVGRMARPVGIRFTPHLSVARGYTREAAGF